MNPEPELGRPCVFANLGAEEGTDWQPHPGPPHVRVAARLFGLLFPSSARLVRPIAGGGWQSDPVHTPWPVDLDAPTEEPAFPWLDTTPAAMAWLNTRTLAQALGERPLGSAGARLAGPDPGLVAALHDKRFAIDAARRLALQPPELDPLIEVFDPGFFARPDAALATLAARLTDWPAWTGRRFTLKPRLGSSGRGRVGGQFPADLPRTRGAFARLARQGGAILEPWLPRTIDLSVALRVAQPGDAPEILASFELLTSASGVYRGHGGEVDAMGRIRSGDPDDERLRSAALDVASLAASLGFHGPCGLDAFRFLLGPGGPERFRPVVEFNARPTMGLVAAGLLRRAARRIDARVGRAPERPCGFLFTLLDPKHAEDQQRALVAGAGPEVDGIDLTPNARPEEPRALLLLGPDRKSLRAAYRHAIGC